MMTQSKGDRISQTRLTNKKGKQCLYIKRIKNEEDTHIHHSCTLTQGDLVSLNILL